MKTLYAISLFSLLFSSLVMAQINVADGIQLQSDGEILLDDKMYNFTTEGNSQIFFRHQKPEIIGNKNFIEGNTLIEFDFNDINSKNRRLENLLTVMQINEGFNLEYKKYLNDFPDQGTFCSDFSGEFKCFTISAYFCSKLYRNLGNQTNVVKNKMKIMECYEKVDFLRFFTSIKEDPETKNLKKLTEENVAIMKKRFVNHFGKRKTKGAFQSVDLDLISGGGDNDRAEYFVQLMKTINACEEMFKTSKVLKYAEIRMNSIPATKASEQ